MIRTMNKKVVFSPDDNYDRPPPAISKYKKQSYGSGGAKAGGGCYKKRVVMMSGGASSVRNIPKSSSSETGGFSISAVRFIRRVGAKVAKSLRLMSSGKKWSRKVSSSSSSSAGLARSWSYAECSTLDSQRAEAIEDCIEFLNSSSSSSLQRSYSAASCSSC